MITLDISGDQELLKSLAALNKQITGKLMKNAMRAGGRVVVNQVKDTVPVGKTGNLKKSIKTKMVPYPVSGITVLVIGAKAPHAHLVEFGHGGPHPAPPHPFMRPAFDASKLTAQERVERNLRNGIKRETKRLAKK